MSGAVACTKCGALTVADCRCLPAGGYTMDGACVIGLLQQEIDYLRKKVADQEGQLVQISRILEGDARDCKGEDKSIAGLVAERLDDEGQCVLAWTEQALKAERERDEARELVKWLVDQLDELGADGMRFAIEAENRSPWLKEGDE